jgi:hypothetical protein
MWSLLRQVPVAADIAILAGLRPWRKATDRKRRFSWRRQGVGRGGVATGAGGRSMAVRVGGENGVGPLLAFSIFVPTEDVARTRARSSD